MPYCFCLTPHLLGWLFRHQTSDKHRRCAKEAYVGVCLHLLVYCEDREGGVVTQTPAESAAPGSGIEQSRVTWFMVVWLAD